MGKYVFIYYAGKDADAGDDKVWGEWFGKLGDKLIDGGNPFNDGGKAVHMGGVMDVDHVATGYSIVSASSMDEAVELSKGCPLVSVPDCAVCVYEALPM